MLLLLPEKHYLLSFHLKLERSKHNDEEEENRGSLGKKEWETPI